MIYPRSSAERFTAAKCSHPSMRIMYLEIVDAEMGICSLLIPPSSVQARGISKKSRSKYLGISRESASCLASERIYMVNSICLQKIQELDLSEKVAGYTNLSHHK